MGFFKKKKAILWHKSLCVKGTSHHNFLWETCKHDSSFNVLYAYYRDAAPVADAIDRVAKEFASIEPKIYDSLQDKFVENDFLQVLENPNSTMTKHQFLMNIAINYQICNNLLIYGTGVSKLQELDYVEPNYLNLYADQFNRLERIVVNKGTYSQEYRQKSLNNDGFFIAPNQVARFLRGYNTSFCGNRQFALSKLASISYEIEQFLAASNHNLALMGNMVKPSAILESQVSLDQTQQDALREHLRQFYSGSDNAGQALLLPDGIKFNELNTRTDSDFQVLRENVERSIYKRLEIPIALISNSAMTFNNLQVANLQLYDSAVLPLTRTLYKQLQDIIFYYGKIDPKRYCIWYDVNEIEALSVRKSQIIKDKASTNSYTMNEIRQMYGDKDLDADGNTVYIQSTMIPAASNNDPNQPQNEDYVSDGINETAEINNSQQT